MRISATNILKTTSIHIARISKEKQAWYSNAKTRDGFNSPKAEASSA